MELQKLPRDIEFALSGAGFRARRRLAVPFLTVDPGGFPRAALLTLGEVRARSRVSLAVAVRAGSRTAANLIRRRTATLLYLARNQAVWVQARAGRARDATSRTPAAISESGSSSGSPPRSSPTAACTTPSFR